MDETLQYLTLAYTLKSRLESGRLKKADMLWSVHSRIFSRCFVGNICIDSIVTSVAGLNHQLHYSGLQKG